MEKKCKHYLDPSIWTTLSARGSARGSTEPSIKPRRRNSILRDLASELGIMKSADIKQFVVQLNLQTETDTDFTSTSNFYTTSIARLSTLSQYFLRILSTFMRWFRFPNVWISKSLKFSSFKNCLIHLNKMYRLDSIYHFEGYSNFVVTSYHDIDQLGWGRQQQVQLGRPIKWNFGCKKRFMEWEKIDEWFYSTVLWFQFPCKLHWLRDNWAITVVTTRIRKQI